MPSIYTSFCFSAIQHCSSLSLTFKYFSTPPLVCLLPSYRQFLPPYLWIFRNALTYFRSPNQAWPYDDKLIPAFESRHLSFWGYRWKHPILRQRYLHTANLKGTETSVSPKSFDHLCKSARVSYSGFKTRMKKRRKDESEGRMKVAQEWNGWWEE